MRLRRDLVTWPWVSWVYKLEMCGQKWINIWSTPLFSNIWRCEKPKGAKHPAQAHHRYIKKSGTERRCVLQICSYIFSHMSFSCQVMTFTWGQFSTWHFKVKLYFIPRISTIEARCWQNECRAFTESPTNCRKQTFFVKNGSILEFLPSIGQTLGQIWGQDRFSEKRYKGYRMRFSVAL